MSTSGVNNVRSKVETAVLNWLIANADPGPGVNAYRSRDVAAGDERVAYPHIAVMCRKGRPFDPSLDATSGATNRIVTVEIHVKSRPVDVTENGTVTETARELHDRLVGIVMDSLHVDGLPAAIQANAPPGVAIERVELPEDEDIEDPEADVTAITFDVQCYGTREQT